MDGYLFTRPDIVAVVCYVCTLPFFC